MSLLTIIFLFFSVLGALDNIFGNRFGLGKEYEKAFMLLGTMALSMIGMIVVSPVIANIMTPLSDFVSSVLHIDPSVIPASLFANDMGGAPLSVEMAKDADIGGYNALVVSSMMGCTISFTIPFALGIVNKSQHNELFLGILCGLVTIPIGCFVSGLICKLDIVKLIMNLIPLIVISGVIAVGLIKIPEICIKVFKIFGVFIRTIIIIGLSIGVINFLCGKNVIGMVNSIEEGADVCLNATIVLSGAFPFMYIISKLLTKPLEKISKRVGVNQTSVLSLVSGLVTSATSFGLMDKMDKKGVTLNSAFCVSGAFVLGGHLAFTMAFDSRYILPVIIGKLVSGISSVMLANVIYDKKQ